MSPRTPRHRRSRQALALGLPLAVTAAGALAYGLFGAGTQPKASAATAAVPASTPWTDMSGFSWKNDRFAEYRNTGAGAGAASSDRPQLTDAQAAQQEVADWLGDWTPAAS